MKFIHIFCSGQMHSNTKLLHIPSLQNVELRKILENNNMKNLREKVLCIVGNIIFLKEKL